MNLNERSTNIARLQSTYKSAWELIDLWLHRDSSEGLISKLQIF